MKARTKHNGNRSATQKQVWINPALHARVKAFAKADGRHLHAVVERAVERGLIVLEAEAAAAAQPEARA